MNKKKSKCQCDKCKFGDKLVRLTEKYKMAKDDEWFLLNDVFNLVEGLKLEVQFAKRDAKHPVL